MRPTTRALSLAAAVVLAAAVSHDAAAQTPQTRFTGGPVTLADQGSFFIGGVTKISEHASIPGAPPNQPVPHAVRILKERGHLNLVKGLITIEGGCSLPQSGLTPADFDAIPYLVVKGDYR